MTALDAIERGREAAERLMLDTCTITRISGPPGPIDPETGLRDPAPTTTVYSGKCRVQTYEPYESNRDSGGHIYTEQRYSLHLPIGAGPVDVNDESTITSAESDPQLLGRVYRIAGRHNKSLATAQRLPMEEVLN